MHSCCIVIIGMASIPQSTQLMTTTTSDLKDVLSGIISAHREAREGEVPFPQDSSEQPEGCERRRGGGVMISGRATLNRKEGVLMPY